MMLGSPNGPAYGSQPKLVVMKVLCKLRWKKIRHPLIFPHSLHLHPFFVFLSAFRAPCSFSPPLSIFLTRCVFLSVSLHQVLSFLPSFYSFIYFTFSLSSCPSYPHHHSCLFASLSFLSSFMLIACSASLPKSICPSSAVCLSLFLSALSVAFLRHS